MVGAAVKWQPFIPANDLPEGRYLVLRPDQYWHIGLWFPNEFRWAYEDSLGRINDVLYYMESTPHG